jgi:hypothetical protein
MAIAYTAYRMVPQIMDAFIENLVIRAPPNQVAKAEPSF